MSEDPYPSDRPDPRDDGPYSSDPYVQPRPSQPAYGPPATAPLSPPPGEPPAPGAPQYPAYVPPPLIYPPPTPPNSSAIVLTVFSGLTILTGYCCIIGIGPLVFGILGITQQAHDPESAARMTKIGWALFAGMTLLVILGLVLFIVLAIASES